MVDGDNFLRCVVKGIGIYTYSYDTCFALNFGGSRTVLH